MSPQSRHSRVAAAERVSARQERKTSAEQIQVAGGAFNLRASFTTQFQRPLFAITLSGVPNPTVIKQPMNTSPAYSTFIFPIRSLLRIGMFCAALVGLTAFAQSSGSITGIVTDKSSGYLVGADVRIVGTEIATATARDGTFTLSNVPTGQQSIEVSYVGRKTKTVPVNVSSGAPTIT